MIIFPFFIFIINFCDINKNLTNNDYLSVNSPKDISIGGNYHMFNDDNFIHNTKKRFVFSNGKFRHFSTVHTYFHKGKNAGEVEIFIQKDKDGNHIINSDYSKAKGGRIFTTITSP